MASAKALALAAVVGFAAAACPNQCSGHGKCGPFDKCICFKSSASTNPSRFAYTGADCSQRSCPLGLAPDAISTTVPVLTPIVFTSSTAGATSPADGPSVEKLRAVFNPAARSTNFVARRTDANFQIKIMSVSSDSSVLGTFSWKFEEDAFFLNETTIKASESEPGARALSYWVAGTEVNTGVSVFWDATFKGSSTLATPEIAINDLYTFSMLFNEGATFDEGDSNTAHQERECSGRGLCDSVSGKCTCPVGYTGVACERNICPNDCSGHGSCQSQQRFVTDAGITIPGSSPLTRATYAGAYDRTKEFGCKCDVGYRGADCSEVECPSNKDPLGGEGGAQGRDCSGRGVCDYTTGTCVCSSGYHGEACDVQFNFY